MKDMFARLKKLSNPLKRSLKLSQKRLQDQNKDKVLVNGKWITRKSVEFDVEPVHANTDYLYQKLYLSTDWKERIPLSRRFHGAWGYGILFGPLCKLFKFVFMDFKKFGEHEALQRAVAVHPNERKHKIFTVCNHIANIDDPTLISLMYKYPGCYFKSDHLR